MLSPSMIAVLKLSADGKSLYRFCIKRSQHGARTCTIAALRRRGLLEVDEITDAGRIALSAALKRGF